MDGKTLRKEFGKRIKHYRRENGYSQAELAEKTGISVNQVSFMERGLRFASPETLCTLADTLDTKLSSFFDDGADVEEDLVKSAVALVDAYHGMTKLASNQLRKMLYENAIAISGIYSGNKQVAGLRRNLEERYRMLAGHH